MFHKTAIICTLLYFVRFCLFYKIRWFYPIIALFLAFSPSIIQLVAKNFGGMLFGRAALHYLENVLYNVKGIKGGRVATAILLENSIFLLIVKAENREQEFFLSALGLYLLAYACVTQLVILDRLTQYFRLLHVIPLVYVADLFVKKHNKKFFYSIAVLFCLFFGTPSFIARVSPGINRYSGRPTTYQYIPYYNALWHPSYAEHRKDYSE